MTDTPQTLTDSQGIPVEVRNLPGEGAYAIFYRGENQPVGRAYFLDRVEDQRTQRILHHTVVDPEFNGRGLAGLLVKRVLEDASAEGVTVTPVCSYVSGWVTKNAWSGKVAPVTDEVLDWVAYRG